MRQYHGRRTDKYLLRCLQRLVALIEEQSRPLPAKTRQALFDTSVFIDGRILPVLETGALGEIEVIVPSFIMDELRHIADSLDEVRRARGKRGLDTLDGMKKLGISLSFPNLPPDGRDADNALIELAQTSSAEIFTTDSNLAQIAAVQNIRVVNLNKLAHALLMSIVPGEEITIQIVGEGKEYAQGIGFLDDGTMVVVEEGHKFIGTTVAVVIRRVFNTPSGHMLFADQAKPVASKT